VIAAPGARAVVPAARSEPRHYVFVIAGLAVKQGSDQVNSTFEGDLIRPQGLVTLYCGYAERELYELLEALSPVKSLTDRQRRRTVGQKLAQAQKWIHQLGHDDLLAGLRDAVAEGRRLFERRNSLIHGCLYAEGRLVSSRDAVAEERVTAEDLTRFAESVFAWKERIWLYRQTDLQNALLEDAAAHSRS
jgi:hypothetical protein